MLLGMTLLIYLTSGSILKALVVAVFGAFFGTVGIDPVTGEERFTFGIPELQDGVGLVPMAMGLFGISEVLINSEIILATEICRSKIRGLLPTAQDWIDSTWPILRGSILGFFIGIIPGGGGVIASFISYAVEKKFSKHPEKFGKGAIEGVAGPESANNSATGGAFIPLLTLGIPSNVVIALLLGALLIHGVQPGPLFIKKHPDIFWGVIGSMYIGNLMLLILNLPLLGLWVQILRVPHKVLFPLILLFCLIGSYSVNNSWFDVQIMLLFGVIGYIGRKFEYEPAPLILAYILAPMLETSFRQSLVLSNGSLNIFLLRPIAAGGLLIAALFLLSNFIPAIRKRRDKMRDQK
jgi:putative tricarboxylic transport membrane protein